MSSEHANLLVLGDIHGNLQALASVILGAESLCKSELSSDTEAQTLSAILLTGDIGSTCLSDQEVVDPDLGDPAGSRPGLGPELYLASLDGVRRTLEHWIAADPSCSRRVFLVPGNRDQVVPPPPPRDHGGEPSETEPLFNRVFPPLTRLATDDAAASTILNLDRAAWKWPLLGDDACIWMAGLGGSNPCPKPGYVWTEDVLRSQTSAIFSQIERDVASVSQASSGDLRPTVILLSHAPPQGTRVDEIPGSGSVGSTTVRHSIIDFSVLVAACGHIHEARGSDTLEGRKGTAFLVNPGAASWCERLKQSRAHHLTCRAMLVSLELSFPAPRITITAVTWLQHAPTRRDHSTLIFTPWTNAMKADGIVTERGLICVPAGPWIESSGHD